MARHRRFRADYSPIHHPKCTQGVVSDVVSDDDDAAADDDDDVVGGVVAVVVAVVVVKKIPFHFCSHLFCSNIRLCRTLEHIADIHIWALRYWCLRALYRRFYLALTGSLWHTSPKSSPL